MKADDFINKCLGNDYAWTEGKQDGKDGYFIGCERLDTVAHFTPEAIEQNDWPALESQIIQGKDVYHVSRIVGYFSRIENWNKSKHGELADRHIGDYKLEKDKK